MKASVAVAKEADAKKGVSSTKSDNSIPRLRDEPERQLGSLRGVIGNIRSNGGKPSVENIATQLSSMHTAQRTPVLLALQQTHGNRYVQRVVAGIQAKLVVGQPGDKYEREADLVADAVMRMSELRPQRQTGKEKEEEREKLPIQAKTSTPIQTLTLQRQDDEEEEELKIKKKEEEEETLQAKEIHSTVPKVTPHIESRIHALKEGGQPLSESDRTFFEPRLGYNFSDVRVHTGDKAAETAKALNARAFTMGRKIVFGAGQYASATTTGKRLLAHELTHVVQQGLCSSVTKIQRVVEDDITQMSVTEDWARNLEDDELEQQIQIVRDQLMTISSDTPEFEVARSNLQILEQEVSRPGRVTPRRIVSPRGRGPIRRTQRIPVTVNYTLLSGPLGGSPSGPVLGRSERALIIGRSSLVAGGFSLSYLLAPPLPRVPTGGAPGTVVIERYVGPRIGRELIPRFRTERWTQEIAEAWRQRGLNQGDLRRFPELVRRRATTGLTTTQEELLRRIVRGHAEIAELTVREIETIGGRRIRLPMPTRVPSTAGSPALSATRAIGQPQVLPEVARTRWYVVEAQVPREALVDVGEILGTRATQGLSREVEVLVAQDLRGNITRVRPNIARGAPLARVAGAVRWAGPAFIVIGVGISTYRIGTATERERARVIGEEIGGLVGGLALGAAAAAACAPLGPFALLCGLAGGIGGGLGGSAIGAEIGEAMRE